MKPIKSAFACIRFLIVNATCHNADDATFDAELQQLGKCNVQENFLLNIKIQTNDINILSGLPKEHSAAMCKIRSEHLDAIRAHLTNNSLKGRVSNKILKLKLHNNNRNLTVNELSSISYTIPRETTVDCAQLTIEIANELVDGTPTKTSHKINVSKADICILLDELRTIDKIMQDMNYEQRNKSVVNSNGK